MKDTKEFLEQIYNTKDLTLEKILEQDYFKKIEIERNEFTDEELSKVISSEFGKRLEETFSGNFQERVTEVKRYIQISKNKETLSNDEEEEKKKINAFFEDINIKIENLSFTENNVAVEFNKEEFLKEMDDKLKWLDEERIEYTFHNEFNVPLEKITKINSLKDYLEKLSNLEEEMSDYLSRGQGNCAHMLTPSLFRKPFDKELENKLIEVFKQKVSFYDKDIKGRNQYELTAFAQHFGLPTRYLDFTEAHLLSLFFAVENVSEKNPAIVYFVNSKKYNYESIRKDTRAVNYSDPSLGTEPADHNPDRSYFIKVDNSHERIHFQKGSFLKVADDDDLKILLTEFCEVALIPENRKEGILKELISMGITHESIYPDIDNLVKNIKINRDTL